MRVHAAFLAEYAAASQDRLLDIGGGWVEWFDIPDLDGDPLRTYVVVVLQLDDDEMGREIVLQLGLEDPDGGRQPVGRMTVARDSPTDVADFADGAPRYLFGIAKLGLGFYGVGRYKLTVVADHGVIATLPFTVRLMP